MTEKSCTDCKFSILEDYGYSSYTVEGSSFYCAKRLNPSGTFDQFYGTDPRLEFANECTSFVAGNGVIMDVDQLEIKYLTEEQLEVWDMHQKAD